MKYLPFSFIFTYSYCFTNWKVGVEEKRFNEAAKKSLLNTLAKASNDIKWLFFWKRICFINTWNLIDNLKHLNKKFELLSLMKGLTVWTLLSVDEADGRIFVQISRLVWQLTHIITRTSLILDVWKLYIRLKTCCSRGLFWSFRNRSILRAISRRFLIIIRIERFLLKRAFGRPISWDFGHWFVALLNKIIIEAILLRRVNWRFIGRRFVIGLVHQIVSPILGGACNWIFWEIEDFHSLVAILGHLALVWNLCLRFLSEFA